MNRRALVLNIFACLCIVFCVLVFAFIQTTPDINNYDDDDDEDGIYEPIVTASNTSKVVELPPQPANTQVVKERRVGLLAEVNWRHLIKTVSVFLVGLCALGILVYGLYKGFLALKECLDRVESVTETIDYEAQLREELGIVGSSGNLEDDVDDEVDSDSIIPKANWILIITTVLFGALGLGSLYVRRHYGKTLTPSKPLQENPENPVHPPRKPPVNLSMTMSELIKKQDGQEPSKTTSNSTVPFSCPGYKLGSEGPFPGNLKDRLSQQAKAASFLQNPDKTKYEQEKATFMKTCKEVIDKVDDDQFKEMVGVLSRQGYKPCKRDVEEFPELACFKKGMPDFSKMSRKELTDVLAVYYFSRPSSEFFN